MYTAANDRRSLKTRTALHVAFRDLLLDRGYDALQIGDVIDRANVGRSTFYEHFASKADLLRASVAMPLAHMADMVLPAIPPAHILPTLHHFRDHQQVVRALLGWPTRPILSHALTALVLARLPGAASADLENTRAITARLIADAQLALLDIWILGRPACTAEDAAGIVRRSSVALAMTLVPDQVATGAGATVCGQSMLPSPA